tara:strand:- start:5415 stop:6044 length:630 start_codon:yes stop_codon:yes gene_type:complete
MVKAKKNIDSVDFEFEVEEYLDVETKKTVKLSLNFRKIYDPYYSKAETTQRIYLTEDEYKKTKRKTKKDLKKNKKGFKKQPLKITFKERLRWSDGRFLSNAEMESLSEIAKQQGRRTKTLAKEYQRGDIIEVIQNNYNQHNAKQLILDANQKNKDLIVNIILDDGTTYDFQGEDILNNSTVQTILNQQLNQTYYSIFDYGKKYKGGEKK